MFYKESVKDTAGQLIEATIARQSQMVDVGKLKSSEVCMRTRWFKAQVYCTDNQYPMQRKRYYRVHLKESTEISLSTQ